MRPVPHVLVVLDRTAWGRAAALFPARGDDRVGFLLRDPEAGARSLLEAARSLSRTGAIVLVSDRVDVALAAGADGVHLPERGLAPADARVLLGRERLVGASRHDAAGVAAAFGAGADYVTLSPVWESPGKGAPIGIEALARIARVAEGPVLALGGVDESRIDDAIRAGAAGVAVARAVTAAADPTAALERLLARLDEARRGLLGLRA